MPKGPKRNSSTSSKGKDTVDEEGVEDFIFRCSWHEFGAMAEDEKFRMDGREIQKVKKIKKGRYLFLYNNINQSLHALWIFITPGYVNKSKKSEIQVDRLEFYPPLLKDYYGPILEYSEKFRHFFYQELSPSQVEKLVIEFQKQRDFFGLFT